MDGMNHVIDPREEVKKLQNLVRQLELQNAQLRSKQAQNKQGVSPTRNLPAGARKRNSVSDKNDNVVNQSLEDVEVIDLEKLDLSEEDSWLFSSPKKLTAEQKSISPYKWMRRDVEDPNNTELQTVKRALVNKMDEIARARFSGLGRLQSPSWSASDSSESPVPHLKPSLGCGKAIDSRTFTRPKKNREEAHFRVLDGGSNNHHHLLLHNNHHPHRLEAHRVAEMGARSSSLDVDTPDDDCLSIASDGSFGAASSSSQHRLADVVDVQALARMQEESLRECSPVSSPRRSSASSSQQSVVTSPLAGTDSVASSHVEQVMSDSGRNHFSHSNPDSLDESLHSSPSGSPYGSQSLVEDGNGGKSGSFCHSLPNLSKPHQQNGILSHPVLHLHNNSSSSTSPLRQHFSESRLLQQLQQSSPKKLVPSTQGYDTDSDRESRGSTPGLDSRIQPPQMRRESLQSTTPRSGSPSRRTGIPQLRRSGSPSDVYTRSGLPKPVQRGIPAPRARSSLANEVRRMGNEADDSWKEGCF